MPLIILEGPDGSGKSTLAQRLLKGTGLPTLLVKRSGPPGAIETLRFQAQWINDQAKLGLNIIADRHPLISEAIYAPVVRKVEGPGWVVQDVASAILKAKPMTVLLVYCRTGTDSMIAGSHVEEQMDGVHEYYGDLVREYDRWMDYLERSGVPMVRYDYRKDPVAKHITNYIKGFWEYQR